MKGGNITSNVCGDGKVFDTSRCCRTSGKCRGIDKNTQYFGGYCGKSIPGWCSLRRKSHSARTAAYIGAMLSMAFGGYGRR